MDYRLIFRFYLETSILILLLVKLLMLFVFHHYSGLFQGRQKLTNSSDLTYVLFQIISKRFTNHAHLYSIHAYYIMDWAAASTFMICLVLLCLVVTCSYLHFARKFVFSFEQKIYRNCIVLALLIYLRSFFES